MRNKSVENRVMTWRIYLVARVKRRVIVEYWEGVASEYNGKDLGKMKKKLWVLVPGWGDAYKWAKWANGPMGKPKLIFFMT